MLEWNIFIVKTKYANTKVKIPLQVYFLMALVKKTIEVRKQTWPCSSRARSYSKIYG